MKSVDRSATTGPRQDDTVCVSIIAVDSKKSQKAGSRVAKTVDDRGLHCSDSEHTLELSTHSMLHLSVCVGHVDDNRVIFHQC